MLTLFGIKNCDTVKKARTWLDAHNKTYTFHDYRTDGLDETLLNKLENGLGWENMLNKRSTSWRQLSDAQKNNLDKSKALQLMLETPTLIKRPIVNTNETFIIGFNPTQYQQEL
jgi:Spx/MgsR family transcriptional regulator